MNASVIKILNENLWDVVTMGQLPNVAPVAFKTVLPDGKLAVADVFLTKTVENIKENGMVLVSAFDPATHEGYKIAGKAVYQADGEVADSLKNVVSNRTGGKLKAKGAVIIEVQQVFATTPGAGKEAL